MKIQIRVDPERLTVADLLAIEDAQEGKRANHCMVSLITHSMVDEQGQWLEVAQAFQALKQLDLNQYNELIQRYLQLIKQLQENTVPPAKGGS